MASTVRTAPTDRANTEYPGGCTAVPPGFVAVGRPSFGALHHVPSGCLSGTFGADGGGDPEGTALVAEGRAGRLPAASPTAASHPGGDEPCAVSHRRRSTFGDGH